MDWIKMRGSLFDHPKVMAMARALADTSPFLAFVLEPRSPGDSISKVRYAASRYVTVAALLRVWSASRAFGKFDGEDLVLPISSLDDVDAMAGIEGFASAMRDVGWLENGAGIRLPKFKEFNVPMTDAERQAAYRDRKRKPVDKGVDKQGKKSVTVRHEVSRTREEESRGSSSAPSGRSEVLEEREPVEPEQPQPSSPRARAEPTALQIACRETWDRYAEGYRLRWQQDPIRDVKANSMIKQFCQAVPMAEAPEIAMWYCAHPRGLYVSSHHALNLLVRDANGLRTEWLNNRPQTSVEVQQGERTAARGAAFQQLLSEAEAREKNGPIPAA